MSRPREDKNPVVIGRLGRIASRPTITFYGHYDVQPAMEREWATDPFQVHSEDGYFYGRGTSDNKVRLSFRPVLAILHFNAALKDPSHIASPIELHVNVLCITVWFLQDSQSPAPNGFFC